MQKAWTARDQELLTEKYKELSNNELAVLFNRTVKGIEKKLGSLGLKRERKADNNRLLSIYKRAYSEAELERKFNFGFSYVEKNCPEGFVPYRYVNNGGVEVIKIMDEYKNKLDIKPRTFKASISPSGDPYLWIRLNDDCDRIDIKPIGDTHTGHEEFNRKKFEEMVEYIASHDNVYCFFGGDMVELASKHSVGSGVYEQSSPMKQINDFIEMVSPIAHKVLWYIGGNHDSGRSMRELGIDVAQFIAEKLQIPYFSEPVHVDIYWKKNCFKVFDQHGSSGSVSLGGKLNKAQGPLAWQEFTHFFVMHHVHSKLATDIPRIIRDKENFRLEIKKQYVVIAPSFLDYFNTYGSRNGYPPMSDGSATLKIYKCGDYHAGS